MSPRDVVMIELIGGVRSNKNNVDQCKMEEEESTLLVSTTATSSATDNDDDDGERMIAISGMFDVEDDDSSNMEAAGTHDNASLFCSPRCRRRRVAAVVAMVWSSLLVLLALVWDLTTTSNNKTLATNHTIFTPNGTVYIPIPATMPSDDNITISQLSHFPRHAYRVDVTMGTTTESVVRVLTPPSGGLVKTSVQAVDAGCQAAVNGGPFHADGTSIGVLVTNGQVRQTQAQHADQLVGVGLTRGNATAWILGAPPQDLRLVEFFVTGFGWLVYEGENIVPDDDDENDTGAVRAPRTAVGVKRDGTLVFVVVDGCEYCMRKRGVTLHELGYHLANDAHLEYAINLDGGSSTVLIGERGEITNHPTCLDVVPYKCERPVATVFCLGSL